MVTSNDNETPKPETPATDKPADSNNSAEKPTAEKPATDKTSVEQAAKEAGAQQSHQGGGPKQNRGGGGGGGRNFGGGGRGRRDEKEDNGLEEKVVFINRCAKAAKGGRRFSFSALVVAGDHKGKVGYGFGKAKEVVECIRKASDGAANSLQSMTLKGDSIPHETYAEFSGGKVLLKPASPGTGIIAGGGVRVVCEAVGIKDVLGKSLGSNNHANVVKATLKALSELRSRDEIFALRGKKKGESI